MAIAKSSENVTKGYKATLHDLTCRQHQFEIGKKYSVKGPIVLCGNGFHFCKNLADVFGYYEFKLSDKKPIRIFEVKPEGPQVTAFRENKHAARDITLVKEIPYKEIIKIMLPLHNKTRILNLRFYCAPVNISINSYMTSYSVSRGEIKPDPSNLAQKINARIEFKGFSRKVTKAEFRKTVYHKVKVKFTAIGIGDKSHYRVEFVERVK